MKIVKYTCDICKKELDNEPHPLELEGYITMHDYGYLVQINHICEVCRTVIVDNLKDTLDKVVKKLKTNGV